jgi:hypothetical protein
MDATITKTKFPYATYYNVIKWDGEIPVETFRTKKKDLAYDKFSEFFRDTYNK